MRVVGEHEDAIAGPGHAAIKSDGRVARDAFGARTLIVPDQPAAAGIERETFIGAGYVHDAFHHHGRVLDLRDIRHGKDPARGEVRDVVLIDLGQLGVTVAAGVAIIGGPVGLRCHWPVAVARFAEQSDLFVVGAELQIERALVEHLAFQSRAGGESGFACEP